MDYVDAFVTPVPDANRAAYLAFAEIAAAVFRDHGALRVVECWGDDVPDGIRTSFPLAVQKAPGESVVFGWILWPSREVRDAAWPKVEADPRLQDDAAPMPFDGKRMIHGGFRIILEA